MNSITKCLMDEPTRPLRSSRATAEEQKVRFGPQHIAGACTSVPMLFSARKPKQFLTKMSSPGQKPPGGSSTRGNKRPSGDGDSNKKPKKAKKKA